RFIEAHLPAVPLDVRSENGNKLSLELWRFHTIASYVLAAQDAHRSGRCFSAAARSIAVFPLPPPEGTRGTHCCSAHGPTWALLCRDRLGKATSALPLQHLVLALSSRRALTNH